MITSHVLLWSLLFDACDRMGFWIQVCHSMLMFILHLRLVLELWATPVIGGEVSLNTKITTEWNTSFFLIS